MTAQELIRQLIQLPLDAEVEVAILPDGQRLKAIEMVGLSVGNPCIIYLEIVP